MAKKYLVLSGLENLQNNDNSAKYVIFGEWMSSIPKRYKNNDIYFFPYNSKSIEVLQSSNEIIQQNRYVTKIYEKLLYRLTKTLNEYHQKSMSLRQWEIILGPWLRHFIDVLWVRWVILRSALNEKYDKIFIIDSEFQKDSIKPNSRNHFSSLVNNSRLWNQNILTKMIIFKSADSKNIHFSIIKPPMLQSINSIKSNDSIFSFILSFSLNVKYRLKKIIEKTTNYIAGENSIVIYNPYLKIIDIFKLSLKLNKLPVIYFLKQNINFRSVKWDRSILYSIIDENDDEFSRFVSESLVDQIPSCYFEYWHDLNEHSSKLNLPKSPEIIYTGSGVITDEYFKMYIAKQVGRNVKYIISQHGGAYGVTLIPEKSEFIEQRTADKWISWGWVSNQNKNIVAGSNVKNIKYKKSPRAKGRSLLLGLPPIRLSPSRLNYNEPMELINLHIDLIKAFSPQVKKNVVIRPAPNHINEDYVYKISNGLKLSKENLFYNALLKSRIFITTHNATTFLETLAWNYPTLIILAESHRLNTQSYVRKEAKFMYTKLEEAGMHKNVDSLASKINDIWPNINEWWNNEEIQKVRRDFCNRYSRVEKGGINTLAELIK